jgi:putative transposase
VTEYLRRQGHQVNGKRVRRLLQVMGLQAIYPKPRTTIAAPGHKIYPYLLRNLAVTRRNQVWSADTLAPAAQAQVLPTFGWPVASCTLRLRSGQALVAVLDWYSRFVLAWQLSNTLDGHFCVVALQQALQHGRPEVFNTDQGAQFTAVAFTSQLEAADIQISMDGRGRALDNVFVERLWRTVKYENVYLMDYTSVPELSSGLSNYFRFYDYDRPHQSLSYRTPAEVYYAL